MVVRLKDLQSNSQASPKKTGVVRLSDLTNQNDASGPTDVSTEPSTLPIATPQQASENADYARLMKGSYESNPNAFNGTDARNIRQDATIQAPDAAAKSREIPILGDFLQALDTFGHNPTVEKVTDTLRSLYVPGAGAANVAGLSEAAGSLVSRLLPRLGENAAGKVAQSAAREAITGAPLGAGQSLMTNPDESPSDLLKNAAIGASAGGGLGAVGKLAGMGLEKGVTRLKDILGDRKMTPAIESESPPTLQTSVEAPVTKVSDVPAPPNQRGLITTFEESGKLNEDVSQRLKKSPDRTYAPITNKGTVEAANRRVADNLDAAEAFALNGTKGADAEQIATGFRLIDEFQKNGQIDRAVNVAESLSKRLTEAGQTVQAASIWNRLTPEGALVAAQRKIALINKESSKLAKPVQLTEKNAADIMDAAAAIQRSGQSQERASQVMDIMDRLRAGQEVSQSEKQTVSDFIQDAKKFVKPERPLREARTPRELAEPRVRDRVISFLDKQEQAARERLKARGITLSSLPLDVYADYALIGAAKIGRGAVKFADWSEQMVKDLGEEIRPYLSAIYEKAQETLNASAKRISQESVSAAEKVANSYLKKNEATLRPEDAEVIRNLAKQVSELSGAAKQEASQDLQAVLSGFEKAGIGRKISAANYIFMLLNPLTQIKNIVGNELMYRLERLARVAATPFDMAASAISGGPRQITFKSGPMTWDTFFRPTKDYLQGLVIGAKAGARGVNPEGLTTAYDISGQAFRSKLNPLTYLEKALGATMKGFDYAAYNRATQQRLREMAYLDALNKGIKGSQNITLHMDRYMSNLDDNIAAVAKEYGKYITLQDSTLLSKALSSFQRGANRLSTGGLSSNFGAGTLVLPFAKTPANLLMRAIDYSPAGFAKAIFNTAQIMLKKDTDLTRADVIQDVTRALLGTGLSGVGLWLASKGVLKGESSGDRDVRELEKLSGISQYQLNASALQRMMGAIVTGNLQDVDQAAKIQPGDMLYQYEWAQPSSIPLALGANIVQERQNAAKEAAKGNKVDSPLKQGYDVVTGALNTLYNTSVLRGLQQALDFQPGEDNKIAAFAENIAKQIPGMVVPSFVSRLSQLSDSSIRETQSPDFAQNITNPAISRVPGMSQQFPQRVNTIGQPQTRQNSVVDLFINPAQRSVYKPSEEAKAVIDLLSETGDTRVAPRAVPKYITGTDPLTKKPKRIDLNAEQLVKYQTIVGQETARLLGQIPDNMPTQKKVDRVIDILNKAGDKGRKEMRKELGLR